MIGLSNRILLLAVAGLTLAGSGLCRGQVPEQILKSFGVPSATGSGPVSLLVGADGALYGETSNNGLGTTGTVFRVNQDGAGYTVLRYLGTGVEGLIQGRDGMLYGTTQKGGSKNLGSVFRLATDGANFTILYSFGSGGTNDGVYPAASLVQGSDGAFYGTTLYGGTNLLGTVFRLDAAGSNYTTLYSFGSITNDGANPQAALVQGSDGALYGVTDGNGYSTPDTLFKLATNGLGYAQLHVFGVGNDGSYPIGLNSQVHGSVYGTTANGGTNNQGTIFAFNFEGPNYQLLYNFGSITNDGTTPKAPPVLGADGAFYGTAYDGGTGAGTVYKINADGSDYRLLRRFAVYPSIFSLMSTDGQSPGQMVQAANGMLYGITLYGGVAVPRGWIEYGPGTIFTISTNAENYEVVWEFSNSGGDGATPLAGLMIGQDGALYGTTSSGGTGGDGTVFKLNSNGTGYQTLHNFAIDSNDGETPTAPLIQVNGTLYGTTTAGGYAYSRGTVFSLNPDGSGYSLVASFGFIGAMDALDPVAPLLLGRDGEFYGASLEGGNFYSGVNYNPYESLGTVFKFKPIGTDYVDLHDFETNEIDGTNPQGGLIQGFDGALYSTTELGGTNGEASDLGDGTVFKVNPDGSGYTVLYNFGDSTNDGVNPFGALLQGEDGALYGTTQSGGTNGVGTVFKLNTNGGAYATLYSFGSITNDGSNPSGSLIQGRDGALYGFTPSGGAYGYGIAFKLGTNGAGYTILYSFGGTPGDGESPMGAPVQGLDGAFYGTTSAGGAMNYGTVFRLGPTPFEFTSFNQLANKTFSLSISGSSNTSCRIDASTNLVNWVTLTNLPNTAGGVQFIDASATNFPRRFYRAFQGPPAHDSLSGAATVGTRASAFSHPP